MKKISTHRRPWVVALLVATTVALGLTSCGEAEDDSVSPVQTDKYDIVMVAKTEGIPWFDDMRLGVEEFGRDYADLVTARQIAPEGGDPAKQVQMVSDLIAQGVDAILVVPNDPEAMRPVLQQAKDQGIVVISHEAPALENLVDYDVEAFDNASFGRGFGAALGEAMGGEGKFAAMVGGMTMETHMAWYEAAIEYIEANYPEMEMVSSQPYEDQNDDAKSRSLAIEILNAHPDLSGFLGFSVSAGANMAAVLQERGKEDVAVSTLGIPSVTLPYVEAGYVDFAQCWRPADAGYVSAMVALKVLQDGEVADGADLGRGGYESVKVDGTMIYGDAPLVLEPGMFPEGEYPF